jgi:hypothetical protein
MLLNDDFPVYVQGMDVNEEREKQTKTKSGVMNTTKL